MLWLLKALGDYWVSVIGLVGSLIFGYFLIPGKEASKEEREGWLRAWAAGAIIIMFILLTFVIR